MLNRRTVVVMAVLIATLGQTAAAQQQKVVEIPIAGGQRISVAIADAGPVPAENERLKIEVAGMLIRAAHEGQPGPFLLWNFSFRSKDGFVPIAVAVDDVTADPLVAVVNDTAPVLQNAIWGGRARPILINATNLPWVYEEKPTIKVFRFTVRQADGSASVLHQLAWFPASAKKAIRDHADKVRHGG